MDTRGRRDLHPRARGLHGGREPGDDESNRISANFGSLMDRCRPGGDTLTSQVSARVVPRRLCWLPDPGKWTSRVGCDVVGVVVLWVVVEVRRGEASRTCGRGVARSGHGPSPDQQ